MDDDRMTPRAAPRRRTRASLSFATPPPSLARTPFSTVGDSGGSGVGGGGGLRGGREGRRGRASLSMVTSPLVLPGAVAAGGAGGSGQRDVVNEGSPWLGGRAESPSTVSFGGGDVKAGVSCPCPPPSSRTSFSWRFERCSSTRSCRLADCESLGAAWCFAFCPFFFCLFFSSIFLCLFAKNAAPKGSPPWYRATFLTLVSGLV